jgi:hypothetical protein
MFLESVQLPDIADVIEVSNVRTPCDHPQVGVGLVVHLRFLPRVAGQADSRPSFNWRRSGGVSITTPGEERRIMADWSIGIDSPV